MDVTKDDEQKEQKDTETKIETFKKGFSWKYELDLIEKKKRIVQMAIREDLDIFDIEEGYSKQGRKLSDPGKNPFEIFNETTKANQKSDQQKNF